MKDQLKAFLAMEGYEAVTSNLPEFLVFLKKEYRHIGVIFVMEVEEGKPFTNERYHSLYESAYRLLEKQGVSEMHILTVLLVNNPERASEICRDDKYAWIIDTEGKQLIIDEGKVADFYGLKAMFECFLKAPEAAENKIKEVEQQVLDDIRKRQRERIRPSYIPWVTYSLVALNIVVFIVCTSTGELLYNIGEVSLRNTLVEGQWYRLITSMFLHGDLAHIFNNMLILYLLGNMAEERLGRWKFGLSYFVCGIIAGLVSLGAKYYNGMDANSIGASGAVYGIFGIALVTEFATINWRKVNAATVRRVCLVLLCIGISLFADAQTEGIDFEAHVGGLCMGAMIGMAWYFKRLRKLREKKDEG